MSDGPPAPAPTPTPTPTPTQDTARADGSGRTALTARVVAALAVALTLGSVGANLMPILLSDFSGRMTLTHTEAGTIAATQLLATAATSIGLSRRAAHAVRRRVARSGMLLAGAGFAASALAITPVQLTAASVPTGAGLGAVLVAATAGMASTEDPDRASTATVLGATVATAVLVIGVPAANGAWSGAGFLLVAVCCLLALPLAAWLPDAPARPTGGLPQAGVGRPGLPLLAGVALLAATDQGAWSYVAELGEQHARMSTPAVSTVLAAAGVIALAGIAFASLAARRFGRFLALAACVPVEAAAKFAVAASASPGVYAVATVVWQAGYLAVLTLVLATVSAADPSGRWAATTSGAVTVGTALGPPVVGALLDMTSYAALGAALAAATLFAAIPLLALTRTGPPRAGR